MAVLADDLAPPRRFSLATAIRRNPTIAFGGLLLLALIVMAILAPVIATSDPFKIAPVNRLRPPSERWWFGTDQFGRDVFSRTVYGARVSLIVGLSVAAFSSLLGLALGLACGYFRRVDGIVMRVMDGLMAIPSILLAIALITLTRPGLGIVIAAIVIPEVPRVVRVVRSVVLSIRAQPYVIQIAAAADRGLANGIGVGLDADALVQLQLRSGDVAVGHPLFFSAAATAAATAGGAPTPSRRPRRTRQP
jgi:peptide/nickel transport system permease protein